MGRDPRRGRRHHAQAELNARQRKVLNRLLDAGPSGFEGGLKTGKYAGMPKIDRATACCDLVGLVGKALSTATKRRDHL